MSQAASAEAAPTSALLATSRQDQPPSQAPGMSTMDGRGSPGTHRCCQKSPSADLPAQKKDGVADVHY
jgi:hypothetical protein